MNTTGKLVACVCIFSTLLMGCYSSVMIDPNGAEKEKLHSDNIIRVVAKDGTEYEFDPPAKADSTAIVGQVSGKQVSIPISTVAQIFVSEFSTWRTVVTVVLGVAFVAFVIVIETVDTSWWPIQ